LWRGAVPSGIIGINKTKSTNNQNQLVVYKPRQVSKPKNKKGKEVPRASKAPNLIEARLSRVERTLSTMPRVTAKALHVLASHFPAYARTVPPPQSIGGYSPRSIAGISHAIHIGSTNAGENAAWFAVPWSSTPLFRYSAVGGAYNDLGAYDATLDTPTLIGTDTRSAAYYSESPFYYSGGSATTEVVAQPSFAYIDFEVIGTYDCNYTINYLGPSERCHILGGHDGISSLRNVTDMTHIIAGTRMPTRDYLYGVEAIRSYTNNDVVCGSERRHYHITIPCPANWHGYSNGAANTTTSISAGLSSLYNPNGALEAGSPYFRVSVVSGTVSVIARLTYGAHYAVESGTVLYDSLPESPQTGHEVGYQSGVGMSGYGPSRQLAVAASAIKAGQVLATKQPTTMKTGALILRNATPADHSMVTALPTPSNSHEDPSLSSRIFGFLEGAGKWAWNKIEPGAEALLMKGANKLGAKVEEAILAA